MFAGLPPAAPRFQNLLRFFAAIISSLLSDLKSQVSGLIPIFRFSNFAFSFAPWRLCVFA
jgi:hypothetical protein